jgi:hypothetical protein
MLRRLTLILALLSPFAAFAQAATAGQVLAVPSIFGTKHCASGNSIYITWLTVPTVLTGDFYRIKVSNSSECPDSTTDVTTTIWKDRLLATDATATPRYPLIGDPVETPAAFFAKAGFNVCPTTANPTVTGGKAYACVAHYLSGGTTPVWSNSTEVTFEVLAPPVPTGVTVSPGDSSLYVSWVDGPSTGVSATKYNVTATGSTGATTQTFTGRTNNRVTGLTNGVTYSITVTSLSAGDNESIASTPAVSGTPEAVNSFWDLYVAEPTHREQGGCGGGAAGLVSLLGVALALRGLRRRS